MKHGNLTSDAYLDALLYNELDAVQQEIARGIPADTANLFGQTGLHHFSARANLSGMALMLEAGATVDVYDTPRNTSRAPGSPLFYALTNGRQFGGEGWRLAMDVLLAHGAEVTDAMIAETERLDRELPEKDSNAPPTASYLRGIRDGNIERPTIKEMAEKLAAEGVKYNPETRTNALKSLSEGKPAIHLKKETGMMRTLNKIFGPKHHQGITADKNRNQPGCHCS